MSRNSSKQHWQTIITDLCWAAWNRLGLRGSGPSNARTTDIEAAILLAAQVLRWDARLLEGVITWLQRYARIVNNERLASLVRDCASESLARTLGGLLASADPGAFRVPLRACRALCSTSWKPEPLLHTTSSSTWKTADPAWKEWGFFFEQIAPRPKLQEHAQILRHNACIRYRYIYGPSLRADVMYLLSVSAQNTPPREMNYLTNVRLAILLGSHHSTIYRIQQDLEAGGILRTQHNAPNRHTATWSVQERSAFLDTADTDMGIVNWSQINTMIFALTDLVQQLAQLTDEQLLVVHLNQFHQDWFPMLADHGVGIPAPFGSALGPLKDVRATTMLKTTTAALQALLRFVTGRQGV